MSTITKLGLRKVMMGMFFMFCAFASMNVCMLVVPPEALAGGLTALSACIATTAVGLASTIYGNVKEHEAKAGSNGAE